MARKTIKKSDPNWGKKIAKQILQIKICIEAVGELFKSIQQLIFSLKKLWLSLAGFSSLAYIPEALNWIKLSNGIL